MLLANQTSRCNIMKNSVVRVCAFGNRKLARAKARFNYQFKKLDKTCSVKIYDEHNMPAEYIQSFGHVFSTHHRGYGYWTWKPVIINDLIESSDDGDIIIYSDLGNFVNPMGVLMYKQILRNLDGLPLPIIANQLASNYFCDRRFTKGDVLDYFSVRSESHIVDTGQFQAGILFFKKTPETTEFFRSWLKVLQTDLRYFDDSPSISHSSADFVDHRHDQSSFSILSKLNHIYSIPEYLFFVADYKQHNNLRFSPILHLRDINGDLPYDAQSYLRYLTTKVVTKITYLRSTITQPSRKQ